VLHVLLYRKSETLGLANWLKTCCLLQLYGDQGRLHVLPIFWLYLLAITGTHQPAISVRAGRTIKTPHAAGRVSPRGHCPPTPRVHSRCSVTSAMADLPTYRHEMQEVDIEKASTHSSHGSPVKQPHPEAAVIAPQPVEEEAPSRGQTFYAKYRPFILGALAAVILGWWISSLVVTATRKRWIVQTVWAWFFILYVAYRHRMQSLSLTAVCIVSSSSASSPTLS